MSAYTDLFRFLAEQNLRFVVVGGVAVILHGYQRLTNDVDLVIDLEQEHALRFVRALTARGMRALLPVEAEGFANKTIRESWVAERNLEVFSFHDPANPLMVVDLFAKPPIEFDVLWTRAVRETIGGAQVRIAAIDDLVEIEEAGRKIERLGGHSPAPSNPGTRTTNVSQWTSSFEDAEERLLDVSLSATPEQRLEWLEEAQRFALECSAMSGEPVDHPADEDLPRG